MGAPPLPCSAGEVPGVEAGVPRHYQAEDGTTSGWLRKKVIPAAARGTLPKVLLGGGVVRVVKRGVYARRGGSGRSLLEGVRARFEVGGNAAGEGDGLRHYGGLAREARDRAGGGALQRRSQWCIGGTVGGALGKYLKYVQLAVARCSEAASGAVNGAVGGALANGTVSGAVGGAVVGTLANGTVSGAVGGTWSVVHGQWYGQWYSQWYSRWYGQRYSQRQSAPHSAPRYIRHGPDPFAHVPRRR
eukprot:932492-Prorocentrum_minimum.AAC.1